MFFIFPIKCRMSCNILVWKSEFFTCCSIFLFLSSSWACVFSKVLLCFLTLCCVFAYSRVFSRLAAFSLYFSMLFSLVFVIFNQWVFCCKFVNQSFVKWYDKLTKVLCLQIYLFCLSLVWCCFCDTGQQLVCVSENLKCYKTYIL